MANVPLKSITFPGLSDTYIIPDTGMVAETFSTSKTYAIGDYCVYNNKLYKFTSAHSAGAWNSGHVTETSAGTEIKSTNGEVSDLKDAFTQLTDDLYGTPVKTTLTPTDDKYFNMTDVFRDGATSYVRNGYNGAQDLEGTACFYKAVTSGDIYEILGVGSGTNSVGQYVITNSNNVVQSSEKTGSRTTPTIVNVDSDGFLYVNFYGYSDVTDYIKFVVYPDGVKHKLAELETETDNLTLDTVGEQHIETLTLTENKYYNTTDIFRDGKTKFTPVNPATLSGTYCVKHIVAVGEKYILSGNTGGTNSIGLYVLTDLDGNVVASQKTGTADPTIVGITTDGFIYVNLRDYSALTDYVKRVYYTDGLANMVYKLDYTLPFYGHEIVNFGDSVFGNKRPPNDVSTALAKLVNASVDNCGFGGCRMAKHILTNFDPFSMYRLAYSVANDSWTLQDDAITNSASLPDSDDNKLPDYFSEALALLKSIDFTKVKSITIAYGTNDYASGVQLDNSENLLDTNCFGGALRYSLETLMTAFPQLQVFVCCPTYRFWMDSQGEFDHDSDTYVNGRGNTMAEFIAKAKDIAQEYHVKFIDNYYELGINRYNRTNWFPATDGTHHNVKGARLIAEHMANEMF